jgi:hypothetical protein
MGVEVGGIGVDVGAGDDVGGTGVAFGPAVGKMEPRLHANERQTRIETVCKRVILWLIVIFFHL